MSEKRVEILEDFPSQKGAYLKMLHDPISGKYFAPELPDHPSFNGIKKLQKQGVPGPRVNVITAIIDTGLMLNHPWIKRSLLQSVDFTGEGAEDKNGHGTMVALLFLISAPDSKIFNVKVLNSDGRGTEEDMIKGIEWAASHQAKIINISAGMYRRKWGFLKCKGDCDICKAAEKAASHGVLIVAAAGNRPDETTCPATVGVVKKGIGVISVGAYDFDQNKRADYSGRSIIDGPVGTYHFVPVD